MPRRCCGRGAQREQIAALNFQFDHEDELGPGTTQCPIDGTKVIWQARPVAHWLCERKHKLKMG